MKNSVLGKCLQVLPKADQKKLLLVVCAQTFLAGLDLVAVALIGMIGSLAVSGVKASAPNPTIEHILIDLNIQTWNLQSQVILIGLVAGTFLVSRTFISIFLSRKTLYFLSRRGAQISWTLFERIMHSNLAALKTKTSQEILFALTNGVGVITLGLIGGFVSIISDLTVLLVLILGLFAVNTVMTIAMFVFFGLTGLILYKFMGDLSHNLGVKNSELSILSNRKILEALDSYREIFVRNRQQYYVNLVRSVREELSNVSAQTAFLPSIGKYVIEMLVVVGSLAFGALAFFTGSATHAVATLTIFIAAGTRIAPAVLRIQQGAVAIRGSSGVALPTLNLMNEFKNITQNVLNQNKNGIDYSGFTGEVVFKDVNFRYPESKKLNITTANFSIASGELCAVVGPSGAGKTTLVDLMLGILEPESGSIKISGLKPQDLLVTWPGSVGYVPQDVVILDGTIWQNVTLGFQTNLEDYERVKNCLAVAQLEDFVLKLPLGFETEVGESGSRLSGGQRQRLGVARALFTNPKFLVLDEATSTLDAETEVGLSSALASLKGEITTVMIAHRLSSVRLADKVIYIEDGQVLCVGTLEEVRTKVPNFDKQAKLMGL